MHLGVALAQVKDEAADVTRLKAVPNCEQKWDHAKKRLLNKETYLKGVFYFLGGKQQLMTMCKNL